MGGDGGCRAVSTVAAESSSDPRGCLVADVAPIPNRILYVCRDGSVSHLLTLSPLRPRAEVSGSTYHVGLSGADYRVDGISVHKLVYTNLNRNAK